MEEIIMKCAEFGILGVFSLLMLTKGLSAVTALTSAIDKLADKLNAMDGRVGNVEREIRDLRQDFLETKHLLKSLLERRLSND